MRCRGKPRPDDNCDRAQSEGVSGAAWPSVFDRLWRLSLSDEVSSESLDSEELLVDSEDDSDEALDGWRRERLLTEAPADVESRSVVAGSPAVGLRTTAEAMPPTAEPAGAGRCVRRCFVFDGGVASGRKSTCAASPESTIEVEDSESLPSSSPARSDTSRCWNRRSTSTSFFPTCER